MGSRSYVGERPSRVWTVLGRVPDRLVFLGFGDGTLEHLAFDDVVARIRAVLEEERPDVVGTFGPDGGTGHPDHVAIGRATTEAFHQCRVNGGDRFRRLIQSAIPQSQMDRWNRNLVDRDLPPWDGSQMYHLRGVPDETIGISVDTRSVAARTVAALRAHASQWSPTAMSVDDDELTRSLRTEDWVIAWPPRSHDPVFSDILEQL